jgi:hypothetical protein
MTSPIDPPVPTSIRARLVRLARRLFVLSLAATLLLGLLPYPIERSSVDPSAPREDSDYVIVHGLPWYFVVTDSTVARRPGAGVLIRHFLLDWGFAFAALSAPLLLLECIRLTAFYAARGVHAFKSLPR